MKKIVTDSEYLLYVKDIIENEKFNQISKISHHNTNRFNHSLRVSYYSYRLAKFLRLDYNEVARGGLLHDFYVGEICDCKSIKDKIKLFSVQHPKDAVKNSMKLFDLTDKEKNIIESHMFPMNYKLPKYAESWIVNIVDKTFSFGEFFMKYGYKFKSAFNILLLILLNSIK